MNTEHAIKLVKDTFQQELSSALHLRRVTAPLFVESGHGLNDDLTGVEKPVSFFVPALNRHCEIVHSLAKWKRMKLWRMNAQPGYGIYTDMNAIRTFETPDDTHSLYVDQWDWCKVLTAADRTREYLHATVRDIYKVLRNVEYVVCERCPELEPYLPAEITFISSEALLQRYPALSPKERENAICKEFGAVFIEGIGAPLSDGKPHDDRAADYDDWSLNGDILIWYPVLGKAIELSSMGIRVDAESMQRQLAAAGHNDWTRLDYHKAVLNNTLPLTIGGGIGQSRLCMVLLHKHHIGEVQVSEWSSDDLARCAADGIVLLQ
jgi:aspartate--ammonia ligase